MLYEPYENGRWLAQRRNDADRPSDWRDGARDEPSHWVQFAGFILALSLLAFLAGAFVILHKMTPYQLLKSAYQAGDALYIQLTSFENPLATDLWFDARTSSRGVTIHQPGKTYAGLTLFTSGHDAAAYLVDMDGQIVHTWRKPFSEVWDETSVVKRPRPDQFVYFDKAHLYPNGDLLAVYVGVGDTPWGLGLVKMDKNSQVIWKYLDRVHHDVEVGEDGRIYTLSHALSNEPMEEFRFLETPYIEDFLVVLSPDGKLEKKISLTRALARSPYSRYPATVPHFARQDPLHTNSVEPIEGEAAKNFPFANDGDVLLSFRESGLVATFDPVREKFTWGTRGPWIGQHDPDLLPNGHLLVFDNNGNVGPDGVSRVLELDPQTMRIVWSYTGSPNQPFESVIRSEQQRLPNGNTLITESDGGRLLEVTPGGELVWEYRNPVRAELNGKERIAVLSGGQRFAASEFAASFQRQLAAERPAAMR